MVDTEYTRRSISIGGEMWRGFVSVEITIKSRSALTTSGLIAETIAITAIRQFLSAQQLKKSRVDCRDRSVGERRTVASESPAGIGGLCFLGARPFDEV